MRISDWSSDVCSSDLDADGDGSISKAEWDQHGADRAAKRAERGEKRAAAGEAGQGKRHAMRGHHGKRGGHHGMRMMGKRSDEHTSELQSLMRISYAAFFLKKNNNTYPQNNNAKHTTCTHK